MKIIVVGCGRLGSDLAYKMFKQGHKVTVIDHSAESFRNLPPDFIGITMEDDVLARDVLRRAGIEKADAVAAVSNSDSTNAVVGQIASRVYHVPNVVVRTYDPKWQPLHEALNLPVVNSVSWGSNRIEELLSGAPLHSVLLPCNSHQGLFELSVPQEWKGISLETLLPDHFEKVLGILREGKVVPASRTLPVEPCDQIYLSIDQKGFEILRSSLQARIAVGGLN